MTDTMLFGILKMPFEMAMKDEISRLQYYARVQELVGRFEAQQKAEPVADEAIHAAWSAGYVEGEKAALEQPEPEKVAWRFWVGDWQYVCDERMLHHLDKDVFFEPLYTMPPKQRKKIDLSPMQEAAQMLRDRAAKQRKDNVND